MMQYAAMIVGLFKLMGVIASVTALCLIVLVLLACARRFSPIAETWQSYRIHLYVKSIYLCIILIGLARTGSWLVSVYAGFVDDGHQDFTVFALLLILAVLGPVILRIFNAFDLSLQSGENFLRSAHLSAVGKLVLTLSLTAWVYVFIAIFTSYFDDFSIVRFVWSYGVAVLALWSLLLIVNDRWINYYVHSATPGAIHHSG